MKESDAGNDIVVVGHSWGGIVVTGALDGLGKVQREQEGKSGGVFKIAYLCAFAPLENVSLIDAQGGQILDFYDVKVEPNSPPPSQDSRCLLIFQSRNLECRSKARNRCSTMISAQNKLHTGHPSSRHTLTPRNSLVSQVRRGELFLHRTWFAKMTGLFRCLCRRR